MSISSSVASVLGAVVFLIGAAGAAEIAAPADVAFPGTIKLAVDATDLAHRIFRVHEEIPVSAGDVTLLYPRWLPGNHAPSGPIDKLAGLVIRGGGQKLAWKRDPLDVYAFHVAVPAGVTSLAIDFDFLSATDPAQGRVMMTPDMLNVQWNALALYPAGHDARRITFSPSVTLPTDWQFGTALERDGSGNAAGADGKVVFRDVPFDTLVDSPMFAGRYYKRVDLGGARAPVHLNIVADAPQDLDFSPAQIDAHKNLVVQAHKLYASQHYDHYEFLLALSDQLGGIGLEHHRSSENGVSPAYFTEWDKRASDRDLLAHEYTHSWNGKFRRPADLWTPNFNVPMQDSLLWVYEGQTQYWGYVLAARSGLWNVEQARDALALVAARYADNRPGFDWRNVQDTTNDPIIAQRRPLPYRSYQLSEDYYSAGQLVWLGVDAKLRELSHDKHSLDDFAARFFGVDDGSYVTKTYTLDDVVAALNAVAPFDWKPYLRGRIDANEPPLDGLAASGWKLVYTDSPSDFQKNDEINWKRLDYSTSIGLLISSKDDSMLDVRWNGPAFKAGIATGSKLIAVNGRAFDADGLKAAIKAAKGGSVPIELLVKFGDEYKTARVDYHDGLKYPHLERVAGVKDRLSVIFAARK